MAEPPATGCDRRSSTTSSAPGAIPKGACASSTAPSARPGSAGPRCASGRSRSPRGSATSGSSAASGWRSSSPPGSSSSTAFFGTLAAGAVPVPLYPPVRLGRLGEYQQQHGPHAGGRRRPPGAGRRPRAPHPRRGGRRGGPAARLPDARGAPARGPRRGGRGRRPGDLALVQFSSGTTVDPKPVALSHRAIVAQAEILNGFWRDTDGAAPLLRLLAAALPRHGADRLRLPGAGARGHADPPRARALRRPAGALAAGALALPRHDLAGPELRLRPLRHPHLATPRWRGSTSPAGARR